MASPRSSRSGMFLVLGLLALGAIGALIARRYRIPGTVPRVLVVPDGAPGEAGPPEADLDAAVLAARVVVVERTTGVPLPVAAIDTEAGGVTVEPAVPGADAERRIEFDAALHEAGAEVVFHVREPGGEAVPVTVRVGESRRSDRADLAPQLLELRPGSAARGFLVVHPPASGEVRITAVAGDGTIAARVVARDDGRPVRLRAAPGRYRVAVGARTLDVDLSPDGETVVD